MLPAGVFDELLAEMTAYAEAGLAGIQAAIGRGDLAGARGIAHSLNGMCLQFGAERTADAARALEAAETLECAASRLPALMDVIHELTAETARFWSNRPANPPLLASQDQAS